MKKKLIILIIILVVIISSWAIYSSIYSKPIIITYQTYGTVRYYSLEGRILKMWTIHRGTYGDIYSDDPSQFQQYTEKELTQEDYNIIIDLLEQIRKDDVVELTALGGARTELTYKDIHIDTIITMIEPSHNNLVELILYLKELDPLRQ